MNFNRIAVFALAGCAFMLAGAAPAVAGGLAFVNVPKVLEQAPQAIAANQRLEKEFEPRNRELVELRKELRRLEDRLEKEGVTMSEAQLKKLEADIRNRKREIRRAQEDYREDLNLRRNEELNRLQKKVYETIVALARDKGYDIVVGDGVIYASPSVDITAAVLKILNEDFKGSGK